MLQNRKAILAVIFSDANSHEGIEKPNQSWRHVNSCLQLILPGLDGNCTCSRGTRGSFCPEKITIKNKPTSVSDYNTSGRAVHAHAAARNPRRRSGKRGQPSSLRGTGATKSFRSSERRPVRRELDWERANRRAKQLRPESCGGNLKSE